jgi:hypothetical protein
VQLALACRELRARNPHHIRLRRAQFAVKFYVRKHYLLPAARGRLKTNGSQSASQPNFIIDVDSRGLTENKVRLFFL